MYFLDERAAEASREPTPALIEDRLAAVAKDAFARLAPARLEWGVGRADVRRQPAGEPRGGRRQARRRARSKGRSITTCRCWRSVARADDAKPEPADRRRLRLRLPRDDARGYDWSGDWPGFAQIELEKAHPGAIALFWAGCGGDQNPLPRRTVELARDYGKQAADGVERRLREGMKPVAGALADAYAEIDLPFAELPTRAKLEADAADRGQGPLRRPPRSCC